MKTILHLFTNRFLFYILFLFVSTVSFGLPTIKAVESKAIPFIIPNVKTLSLSEATINPYSSKGNIRKNEVSKPISSIIGNKNHSSIKNINDRLMKIYTSAAAPYCTPSYNNGVEPITNVTFAGINNTSTSALGGPSLQTFNITGTVVQGSATNAISVKGNTSGDYTEYIKAYIDWNQNGVFGDNANEKYDLGTITNSTGLDAVVTNSNVNVPTTALLGTTTMRVVKGFNNTGSSTNNPCFNGADWGQAEDYFITVTSLVPTITSFTPSNACSVSGATVVITGTNFTGATSVQFNGVNASSFTVNSSTQITAQLPTIVTTGPIKVTTSNGVATSATNFTANPPPGDQTTFGVDSWIGYVYAPTTNNPSSPSTGNYVGYVTQLDNFNFDLVSGSILGPNLCKTYADNFAVQYKMKKNLPAGNYTFDVGGDDGYRLLINGTQTTINNWGGHGYQNNIQTFALSGPTEFILEYYENGGYSRVQFCTVFSLTGVTVPASQCVSTATVTVNSTPAALPVGTYTVTYNRNDPSATGLTATMIVTTAGTGNFMATGLTNPGNSNTTITVTNLASNGCTNAITTNNVSNTFVMRAALSAPTLDTGFAAACSDYTVQVISQSPNATNYYLDVNTSNAFGNSTYVIGYNDRDLGNTIQHTITGLSAGITYYYRFRSKNACGTTGNSANGSFVAGGAVAPTGTASQSFCNSPTPTVASLVASGTTGATIKWYAAATGGSALASTTTLSSGTHYFASQTVGSCESTMRFDVTVTITNPVAPTGTASQSFCNSPTPTVADLAASGTTGATIKWYAAATGGSALASTTTLSSGTHYFASQTVGSCESTMRFDVTATINSTLNNNILTFTNGTSGPQNGTVNEYSDLIISSPTGTYFTTVNFASYGTPTGTSPNFVIGACNATTSQAIVESYLLGNSSATIPAINAVFGDPCSTTYKRLYVLASYAEPICNGSTATISGSLPTGGNGTYSYTWQSSTNPNSGFVTATGTSNGVNYTSGALTQNTYFRRVVTSCSFTSTSAVILVKMLVDKPTASVPTQPDCVTPTGTFKISNFIPTYTYTFSPATGINRVGDTVTASPGGYTITASNGTCTPAVSATITVNSPLTTTYNGSSWSVLPTIKMSGTIATSGVITSDTDLCSCIVNTGVTTSVASGKTLRLQDKLVVNGTGTLTFENNASLVQINNVANSGPINYKRFTAPVRRYDFTYWSSPVFGQTLKDLSPNTLGDKYYSFDAINNSYVISYNGAATMVAGTGYLVRAPQNFDTTSPQVDTNPMFTGNPNNGVFTSSITGNKLYLMGNPYPSALDADLFLLQNATSLEGTLYFWTHNSSPSGAVAGDAAYNYTSSDYASYNRTGGTGTGIPASTIPPITPPSTPFPAPTPLGKIAAGQGFFAPASASGGPVTFNNIMRVGYDTALAVPNNSNSQFFRPSATSKSAAEIERNRLWIDLRNAQGAFKETLLGYITAATNDYDGAFDGESFDGNPYIDFYSINSDKNLAIQGRALPFDAFETIPLGYRSTIQGEFSIAIRDRDGFFTTQKVYLEDKLLGTVFDLTAAVYNFNTAVGVFNDRFALKYTDKTLGVGDIDPVTKGIYIATKSKTITIKSSEEEIDKVFVYDFAGKQLYKKITIDANQVSISGLPAGDVALIVKVVLKDGVTVTQKIIY